jgi:predicted RNA binding protein with dsRBD fold (UPF0201 family)
MTPNTIEFSTTQNDLHNTWVMRITADRRIEVNEEVEVTESAKKVLEAMQWMLDKQKRKWVGLTEDEAFACQGRDYFETYKAIEAKLKEKNT